MEQLADQGDGFYAYVDTLQEAERLFIHDLTSTLQTIAMDSQLFDQEWHAGKASINLSFTCCQR